MLEEVRITGLGVIDDAVLELSAGFTALTGETGAGQDHGGDRRSGCCSAAGPIRRRVRPGAAAGRGRGTAAGHRRRWPGRSRRPGETWTRTATVLVLSRSVSAEGRSRAFAGGRSVPVSLLQVLADDLVAVHGQSDQQQLLRPGRQREALDRFGGPELAALLADYRRVYARHQAVRAELDELTRAERERAAEAEPLRLGLAEIEAGRPGGRARTSRCWPRTSGCPTPTRCTRRPPPRTRRWPATWPAPPSTARTSLTLLGAGRARAGPGPLARPGPGRAGRPAVRGRLPAVRRGRGPRVLHRDAGLRPGPAGRRAGAPGRAEPAGPQLRRRLGGHRRRPGLGQAGRGRLAELEGDTDKIPALAAEEAELATQVGSLAADLTALRSQAADRFAAEVTAELTELAMPHASLTAVLTELDEPGPHGADDVEIRLAAHPGAPPLPLHKGASGGELSRVMLAIEVVFAGADPVPTFVFDEVDAGVGGRAAVEIGRRLARLARSSQVHRRDPPAAGRRVRGQPPGRGEVGRRRWSPPAASPGWTSRAGSGSCPGCWPAWKTPSTARRTPRNCWTWRPASGRRDWPWDD